jgi:hypothetical protein
LGPQDVLRVAELPKSPAKITRLAACVVVARQTLCFILQSSGLTILRRSTQRHNTSEQTLRTQQCVTVGKQSSENSDRVQ